MHPAANLAVALAQSPALRVGLLDVDVFGPSLPRLMGLSGKPAADAGENRLGTLQPAHVDHPVISTCSDAASLELIVPGAPASRGVPWTLVDPPHGIHRSLLCSSCPAV